MSGAETQSTPEISCSLVESRDNLHRGNGQLTRLVLVSASRLGELFSMPYCPTRAHTFIRTLYELQHGFRHRLEAEY